MDWSGRSKADILAQDECVSAWLAAHLESTGSADVGGGRKVATWFRDSGIAADCLNELENLHASGELQQFLTAVQQYAADGVDVGSYMALEGLASSPGLNGELVIVLAYLVERGRYQCEVISGGRQLAVKAERLRKLNEAEQLQADEVQRARAAAEDAAMAKLAECLEANEIASEDPIVLTAGDVDWDSVERGESQTEQSATEPELGGAGERLRWEIRYTLQLPNAEAGEAPLGMAGTVIRDTDEADNSVLLIAGFVHDRWRAANEGDPSPAVAVLLGTVSSTSTAAGDSDGAATRCKLVAVHTRSAGGDFEFPVTELSPIGQRSANEQELECARAALSTLDDRAISSLIEEAVHAFVDATSWQEWLSHLCDSM
eukprot:SAG31_NODE_719_length_12605_cov_22.378858_5_plen_374_part_00